jgi:hypothetical protein
MLVVGVNNYHSHGGRGMSVAFSGKVGKSDILVKLADKLTGKVEQAVRDGVSLYELERSVLQELLNMGRAAVDLFLENQGNGDLGETVTTKEGKLLHRSDKPQPRELRTIFGEHSFASYVYARGAHRAIELRPIDARLNLLPGKASALLEEFSQLFCVEKAFGVGASQFEVVFGQKLSVDVLEDINRRMGEQAERFLETLPKPPAKKEGDLLVLTGDGKGVPLVKQDAAQVPVFEEKLERPGNRRMATLACTYTVDRFVRTPEQILAALLREDKVAPPADRPEPRFQRYFGCFAEAGHDGADAVPSAYGAFAWVAEEAARRWRPGQPVIRLMDGQKSLWDAADACLEELRDKMQAHDPEQQFVDIADLLHVSHYVWRGAKVLYQHREQQEAFVEDRLLRILQGDVLGVVTGMRRMATQRGLQGANRKDMRTVCNYLENNAERMRYHEYLQAGYPIATGVIEGACRHIIKDRMEQGGMRWTLPGAEAMLNVRAVCASSEWQAFHSWRQSENSKTNHRHAQLVANYAGFKA